jgi:hypothetical protein
MIKYLNIVFFAGMVFVNYLANALPLNGKNTGQISDSYANLFAPAGITFVIWGVIYLLLAVYCVVQFTGPHKGVSTDIGWVFAFTCLLNAGWIFAWHYEKLAFSLILMLAFLISLIYINLIIKSLPFGIIKAAFGIYLGWICIATIANLTIYLVSIQWRGFGLPEEVWAIIMIAVGFLIISLSLVRLDNPFIGMAVVWAFIGIAIKRYDDYSSIFISAVMALILLGIITVLAFMKKNALPT